MKNLVTMWTFIILSFGVVFSLYGFIKSLQEKKHPRKENHTISHNSHERYEEMEDEEMTEEEMIAEDYYYYQDKE